ncbi:UDP-N-acetylglucosamine 2-epimerase (non-hydrolyzing) [Parafrankia sp. BMG5.11]|nr:UDP-N-acetylglucosamine 2-epimerase (non-hydrolyzing) [Parafrankia sp. BMG5.11]
MGVSHRIPAARPRPQTGHTATSPNTTGLDGGGAGGQTVPGQGARGQSIPGQGAGGPGVGAQGVGGQGAEEQSVADQGAAGESTVGRGPAERGGMTAMTGTAGTTARTGPSVPTAPSTPIAPTGPTVPTVPNRRLPPDRQGAAGRMTMPDRVPRTEIMGVPAPVPRGRPGPAEHRARVMVLVGTRPEIVKLSRIIAALERAVDVCLVHSGQHYDYELNQVFFDELGIRKPDHFLDAVGASAAETIGRVIARSDAVFVDESPDALLLYGDTNTTLAVIAARRRHIPVFHLEAGNRCFDDRVPEEINRRLVDHLSDINLPLTEHARRHLLAEGLPAQRIFVTGSPMKEVLDHYAPLVDASPVLTNLGVTAGHFLVVSAHREENVDAPELLIGLLETLNALAARYRVPIIVSTHPRTRDRLDALEASGRAPATDGLVRFCRPFGFADYIALQRAAQCVISDSGSLTEEASLLGFPAVMIREAHERPEGVDHGVAVSCLPRPDRVLAAVDLVVDAAQGDRAPRIVPDYDVDDVSRRVVRIIVSHIDYVRRTVWFERPPAGTSEPTPGGTSLTLP